MTEHTSKEVASKAGKIMELAREGGPIASQRELIQEKIDAGAATFDAFESVLRPYIDAAESVAASALTQREP